MIFIIKSRLFLFIFYRPLGELEVIIRTDSMLTLENAVSFYFIDFFSKNEQDILSITHFYLKLVFRKG